MISMITDLNNLIRLKKSQIRLADEMLARAYHDDPVFTYFIPKNSERKRLSPYIFQFLLRYGVLYGEAYATSPNMEGVAIWLPYEKAEITPWRAIRSGFLSLYFRVGKEVISRMSHFTEYDYKLQYRHANFQHWYGFLMGVDLKFQGRGYASALMKPMLARADQEHLPFYLETHKERNVSVYKHYGFKVVEKDTIPGTHITHWAMLRKKSS